MLGRQLRLTTRLYGLTVQRYLTVQLFISTENLKKRLADGSAALDSLVFSTRQRDFKINLGRRIRRKFVDLTGQNIDKQKQKDQIGKNG